MWASENFYNIIPKLRSPIYIAASEKIKQEAFRFPCTGVSGGTGIVEPALHTLEFAKPAGQATRVTVFQCPTCNTLLGRNFNAAHVILDMFLETQNNSLPSWIQCKKNLIKTNNSIGTTVE